MPRLEGLSLTTITRRLIIYFGKDNGIGLTLLKDDVELSLASTNIRVQRVLSVKRRDFLTLLLYIMYAYVLKK